MWNLRVFGIVGAVGLSLLTASSASAAAVIFGSKLNHEPTPFESCRSNQAFKPCSWVLVRGQQNVGHEAAPRNGTIVKLRLRSCSAGTFVLQLARAIPGSHQARATRTGPLINYTGSASNCNGGLFVETFNVSVPVLKGEYLSVVATRVGFIYSSGDREDVFDPPLPDGGPFRTTNNTGLGSGLLLLNAELAP